MYFRTDGIFKVKSFEGHSTEYKFKMIFINIEK